ncbi:uncharacterized protein AB9W97_008564 [Spinachia spinachia]
MRVLCGGCYERAYTGSMAEGRSVYDLEGLEQQLESLLSRYPSGEIRADGKPFCSEFRKLVEEYASRWQVPRPQLRILEIALCYFARASAFFTSNCDHVIHTLSSLALSVFELLLFFEQKDFHQEPLNHFSVTFQECYSVLARHQNVHLLQVERLVRGGGPWAGAALHAILTESSLPQSEADACIGSEPPVFLELRVRYLLSCERVGEAAALAGRCARHPTAGQHLFFLQVYLTWLFKTSQHDRLHKEVAELSGKDAIHIICSLECEEKDELLLALSRAFLSQQLRRGDMCYLCDLVFIWSKLHSRLNTSKQALLEESHLLILSATNVNSIFPFIRAILQELGEDGIQFCVELCANALGSCLPCDLITKSLIYKTIAGLLPNDLEISRACALLIFFLERSVETYKLVYLLYMHPDQEYQADHGPIRNPVRFETLQVLKKDLYFDPEFWNLTALRSNCLKLMSEKVVGGALEEIMENKWILTYCAKEPASRSSRSTCHKGSKGAASKKRHRKEDGHIDAASKGVKGGPGKSRLHVDHRKKKGSQRSFSSGPLRRSFWQLDGLKDNVPVGYGELRRTTRLSEKNPPKRRIRQPKWLLEDSGNVGENEGVPKTKKHGLRHRKHHGANVVKRSEAVDFKNSDKHKPPVSSHLMARENSSKPQKGFSSPLQLAALPQVVLELSLPDNELMGTFNEDTCNRQRGFPQVLLYRPTLKVPATSEPAKAVHRKEVILRARDAAMFVQQLHCYARRQKGKGVRPNIQGSVSTITRSSVQGSPPKEPQRELCDKPAPDHKGAIIAPRTPEAAEITQSPGLEKALETETTKAVSQRTSSDRELSEKLAAEVRVNDVSETSSSSSSSSSSAETIEAPLLDKVLRAPTVASAEELCDESAVEMRVTIASTGPKVAPSSDLDQVSRAVRDASKTSAEVFQTSPLINNQMVALDKIPSSSNRADSSRMGAAEDGPSLTPDVLADGRQELKSWAETGRSPVAKAEGPEEVLTAVCGSRSAVDTTDVLPKFPKGHGPCENESGGTTGTTSPDRGRINEMSALTLVTEMVTELAPGALARDLENRKLTSPEDGTSRQATPGNKSNASPRLRSTSTGSVVGDETNQDFDPETIEDSDLPESEESKLEYSCTFCNKVFRGSRVVEHAMYHYRRDECMFCGTMFKDDLLAMMHLSDHIEKLKKLKEPDGNNVPETKDPSAKAKTTNVSSGRRRSGRTRRSAECPKSTSLTPSTPSGSRQLRSSVSPMPADEWKETPSKLPRNKTHRVNGHNGEKRDHDGPKGGKTAVTQQDIARKRLQENRHAGTDSSPAQQSGRAVEGERVEAQEKVCCPVEGCDWYTDVSRRATLLYHALEDHYGEVKPLEVAFRIENGKCSSCKRVMWSFEHFQHHVGRHRLSPRHPCLHRECTSRFKTGNEMRRHARTHNPLQAVCCVPGCSQLFICLWALNLHEREHYSSKPTKPDQDANKQTGHKPRNTPDGKGRPDQRPKGAPAAGTVDSPDSGVAPCKLRGEGAHNSPNSEQLVPVKEESKERNETTDLHVLKNLSNKDTSSPPAGPNLRLRQTLRKVTSKTRSHKVISSSLQKQNITARHKFKSKQVRDNANGLKRRGRPPKSKEVLHDENTTAGPTDEGEMLPGIAAPLANLPKASESPNASNASKEEEEEEQVKDVVDPTKASINKSKSKKSVNKQSKNNHVKQKRLSQLVSCAETVSTSSADKALQLTAKNLHRVRKRSAPKGSRTASSKKHRATNNEANIKMAKKNPEGVEGPVNKDSTQSGCGNSVPSAPPDSLNERTAPPTSSGEKIQEAPMEKLETSIKKTEGKKEKRSRSASSDSGHVTKKHKEASEGDKKTLTRRTDAIKSSTLKKKVESKSAEAKAATDASPSSAAAAAASGSSDATSPPAEERPQQERPQNAKTSGPEEAGEEAGEESDPAGGAGGQSEAPPVAEEGTTTTTTPPPPLAAVAGDSVATIREDPKCAALREALAGYSRRPYARPPPTAYLDEKYITMPKRRKDPPQRSPPPRQSGAAGRQRCANCFATFDGAEDLQRHLQLQKCSSLFGFESDDEGNT